MENLSAPTIFQSIAIAGLLGWIVLLIRILRLRKADSELAKKEAQRCKEELVHYRNLCLQQEERERQGQFAHYTAYMNHLSNLRESLQDAELSLNAEQMKKLEASILGIHQLNASYLETRQEYLFIKYNKDIPLYQALKNFSTRQNESWINLQTELHFEQLGLQLSAVFQASLLRLLFALLHLSRDQGSTLAHLSVKLHQEKLDVNYSDACLGSEPEAFEKVLDIAQTLSVPAYIGFDNGVFYLGLKMDDFILAGD